MIKAQINSEMPISEHRFDSFAWCSLHNEHDMFEIFSRNESSNKFEKTHIFSLGPASHQSIENGHLTAALPCSMNRENLTATVCCSIVVNRWSQRKCSVHLEPIASSCILDKGRRAKNKQPVRIVSTSVKFQNRLVFLKGQITAIEIDVAQSLKMWVWQYWVANCRHHSADCSSWWEMGNCFFKKIKYSVMLLF